MNKILPTFMQLPVGLVNLHKDGRNIAVGLVDANGMPALGFDVTGCPPNHWRIVEHGNFGAFIGTRHPVEVRVLLDGDLLLETKLIPNLQPGMTQASSLDSQVRAMMLEKPQAFCLNVDGKGKLFNFTPYKSGLSAAQIIAEQIHPGRGTFAPTMDQLINGPEREEMRLDLSLQDIVEKLPDACKGNPEKFLPPEMLPDYYKGTSAAPEQAADTRAEAKDEGQENPYENIPVIDPSKAKISWAPSHGLVAIGVRAIQTMEKGEPPTKPDGFTYSLFQMNTFKMHAFAHTRLMQRIAMPSKYDLHEMAHRDGFDHECPSPAGACGCVHLGQPSQQRKKRR